MNRPAKKCTKCGKTKVLSEFRRRKGAPDGLRRQCHTCEQAQQRQTRHERKAGVLPLTPQPSQHLGIQCESRIPIYAAYAALGIPIRYRPAGEGEVA